MTTLIAVFLPAETTTRLVREVWGAAGYEETDFSGYALPSKDRRVAFFPRLHEHGVVLAASGRLDEEALCALAGRVVAERAGLVVIESHVEATWVTEWDADGESEQEVRNPDWAAKEARREDPGERIAAWQLEEVAGSRLGARLRRREPLYFRAAALRPIDELLCAIEAGTAVTEVALGGRVGFRFAVRDGTRTVFLTAEEIDAVRAHIARAT